MNTKRDKLTRKQKCDAFLSLLQNVTLYEVYVASKEQTVFGGYELKVSTFDYKRVAALDQLNVIACVYYSHIPIEKIDDEYYMTIKIS